MSEEKQSRRSFLATSGSMLGGSWVAWHLPVLLATADFACKAQEAEAPLEVLTGPEAAELSAIAEQIFPSDDTPGAREAGVIYFMDRALGTFMAGSLVSIREGLADLSTRVQEQQPGTTAFAALGQEAQVEALTAIETTPFFGTVRYLTIAGMFAHPSYGGNRDKVGWQLLGFDDRHAWQPPFGYYDEHYVEEG